MSIKKRKSRGQAIVEYIIIVVIVAVAAITIMGVFSDQLRKTIAGVASVFGAQDTQSAISTNSADILKTIGNDGGLNSN